MGCGQYLEIIGGLVIAPDENSEEGGDRLSAVIPAVARWSHAPASVLSNKSSFSMSSVHCSMFSVKCSVLNV